MNKDRVEIILKLAERIGYDQVNTGDILAAIAITNAPNLKPKKLGNLKNAIDSIIGTERKTTKASRYSKPSYTPLAQNLIGSLGTRRPAQLWRRLIKIRPGIAGVILDRAGF